MATIIGSTTSSLWTYKLEAYEIDINIESNTSTVRVDVYIGRASTQSYLGGNWSSSVTVDGQTQTVSGTISYPTYVNGGGWLHLYTRDFGVTHNPDGSKTVGVSSSFSSSDFTPSGASASGNVQLTTIPRATNAPSLTGFIKSSYSLVISPASNSFMHSLQIGFGSITKWLQADGTLGDSEYIFSSRGPLFTIPKEYYAQFDGYEGTGTFTLRTYNNGQLIGTTQRQFKVQCNSALCSPTVTSATVVDINSKTLSITNNQNYIIKYASQVSVTPVIQISDPDDTRATIKSKNIDNVVFTTDSVTVMNPTDKSFQITLLNSRNLSTTNVVSATGELINYVPLTFNIASLYRTEPTTGEIEVHYNGNYFNGTFTTDDETTSVANELIIQWSYREKNEEEWITGGTLTPIISSDNNTYEGNESLGTIFDYTKQYEFMFSYNDKLTDVAYETHSVSRGFPVFWWSSDSFHILGNLYVNDVPVGTDIYSTDEIKTNKIWINGKPIYRRVLNGGVISTDTADISLLDTYYETIIYDEHFITSNSAKETLPLIYPDNSFFALAYVTVAASGTTTVHLKRNNTEYWTGWTLWSIIEYTKNTDPVVNTTQLNEEE